MSVPLLMLIRCILPIDEINSFSKIGYCAGHYADLCEGTLLEISSHVSCTNGTLLATMLISEGNSKENSIWVLHNRCIVPVLVNFFIAVGSYTFSVELYHSWQFMQCCLNRYTWHDKMVGPPESLQAASMQQ
ncbi:uncharacterized protein [Cherax quadricarinatus]|uniref:uncharacterized protein n=1 Tax=Cherax quadricarinatus TaxID=27406 RepID=UPI00387EDDAF